MLNRKPHQRESLERKTEMAQRPGWDIQEERTARAIPGGKRVQGSGCSTRASRKSDVSGDWLRAEDKTTSNNKGKGFRLTRDYLEKIRAEALHNGQRPAFVFGFDKAGRSPREDWIGFPLPMAEQMMSAVDALIRGNIDEACELAATLTRG